MAGRSGWNSYQKLVLGKLSEHSATLGALTEELAELRKKDVTDLKVEIAMLKVKAGLWGATAGVIPGFLAILYVWLNHVK
jgi:hypothetical protein